LVGRAFLAISEDNYAARALGLPEQGLRIASYALAGIIGVLAGFSAGQLLFASLANGPLLNFYGFVPVALGGMGSNRGAVVGGLALGLFQQVANYFFGGIFSSVAVFIVFIVALLVRPEGLAGAATARRV
jgi:branched-chain amino acid transport system permease protein